MTSGSLRWIWPTRAWALRGEIGQNYLKTSGSKDATAIWTNLFKQVDHMSDTDLSLNVLLLFERGCSLQVEYSTRLINHRVVLRPEFRFV